ncbi:MAG: hypothetical protein KIT35_09330 [Piscinibacter sp.]|uniref:hypothetical protein n=1 Tax=Piscinibacter sp. TaxID=1903157 RepID=UPI0025826039|nr:hypothetical protein [Piscinibacter sp.]MCW5664023.1 hypothetical protein [Piscinibacter sp.]
MASKTAPAPNSAPAPAKAALYAYEDLDAYIERLTALALTLEQRLRELADEKQGNLPVVTEWRLADVMAEMLSDTSVLTRIRKSLGIEDLQAGAAMPLEACVKA